MFLSVFLPWPSCKTRGCEGAKLLQGMEEGTTKSWRGFVDKTDARLAPGSVQLYSAVGFSSKDDLLGKFQWCHSQLIWVDGNDKLA